MKFNKIHYKKFILIHLQPIDFLHQVFQTKIILNIILIFFKGKNVPGPASYSFKSDFEKKKG